MGLPESPDYTPERTTLIWDISFDLYRWSESIDAFLEETSLRTVDCPEAYQTYGDVVDYLWRVLGIQNCYNAYDDTDQNTLLYVMREVAWSERGKIQLVLESGSCAGTGYMCLVKLIKAKQIPLEDKIRYLAWVNRGYISDAIIRFLSN